jgi:hypothetical protein
LDEDGASRVGFLFFYNTHHPAKANGRRKLMLTPVSDTLTFTAGLNQLHNMARIPESGREGDMPLLCFSPRKSANVLYIFA